MHKSKLRIAEPCSADWNEMHGDDKKRFCDHCTKHVHNLSAMTRPEAKRLLNDSASCGTELVQYRFDTAGAVQFERSHRGRRFARGSQLPKLVATSAFAASMMAACGWPLADDAPVEFLMGEPAVVEQPCEPCDNVLVNPGPIVQVFDGDKPIFPVVIPAEPPPPEPVMMGDIAPVAGGIGYAPDVLYGQEQAAIEALGQYGIVIDEDAEEVDDSGDDTDGTVDHDTMVRGRMRR